MPRFRMRPLLHLVFAFSFVFSVLAGNELRADDDAARPNIIIIMADDMGYSDIGCYGGEIQTPALDQLAAGGVRMTQFYNTARCCPTRAALLTGLYPHQTGIGWMMSDNGHPGYRGDLNDHCVTIAEVLKTAGYSTYMSGKWHVTRHIAPEGPKHNWPRQRGFDRFYGTITGAGSFFDPATLTRDNTQIPPDEENYYYTDAISNNAITFIDEHEGEEPFFLYVAYTAPHWPMHALPDDIARYFGRYNTGWDALRAERFQRMRKMGLLDDSWELTPRDQGVPSWLEEEARGWQAARMAVYAAMIDRMDLGIGRIVSKLEESGRLENTLILFLADNGGCAEEYGSRGPVKPSHEEREKLRPLGPDELQTRMQPLMTRSGHPVLTGFGVEPGNAESYIAYGKGWANVSNTPFRMYKHWVHEGGIASPLIAHWPAGLDRAGEFEHQPGHVIDLMATCVDVAGADYPAVKDGNDIHPMEGKNLITALRGDTIDREALYWEHEGNRAIRVGKWKLVAKGEQGPWELYDLEADRSEAHDLAAEPEHAERVASLAAQWEAYAQRTNVYPLRPYANRNRQPQQQRNRQQPDNQSKVDKTAPNLILIMCDDMGFEGVSAYGSPDYETPHLDRLAAGGALFRHCYSTPICTPSRVQIMTGQYNHRNYIRFGLLDPSQQTFANVLRDAGYRTAITGKWQLGGNSDTVQAFGFDQHCLWHLDGRESRYWNPRIVENGALRDDLVEKFGPDVVTDFATRFIREEDDRPFLLYYPMMLPHWPFVPTPDSPLGGSRERSGEYDGQPGGVEYFDDMVAYLDKMIGRIVSTLEETGQRDNTLILFTCDNGCATNIVSRMADYEIHGGKGSLPDAGTHVALVASWPARIGNGQTLDALVDFTDMAPTLFDAAGIERPADRFTDGISFLSALTGQEGPSRQWVFCHYTRNGAPALPADEQKREEIVAQQAKQKQAKKMGRFARTQRYKLYEDGRFYDVAMDRLEENPIPPGEGASEAEEARTMLRQVHESMPEWETFRRNR